jgi:pimeloyl-ACP methyl ester carboxylesterase
MSHHVFTAESGRRLGITGLGEPVSTQVVVLCHAAGSAAGFDPDPVASVASAARIIAIDRPGYGASDHYEGEPQLDQWVRDAADYLDRVPDGSEHASGVDVEVVGAVGIGYGCFFAAALAAADPDRVRRLALVAPPRPLHRDTEMTDPAMVVVGDIDPATGLLDRRDAALAAADGYGASADHLLLADAGWAARVHQVRVPATLFVPSDPDGAAGGRWWRRHLRQSERRDASGSGVAMVREVWAEALHTFAG